jgi:hypothetical protein
VDAGKTPDAKTMGRWGVAVGPEVIKQVHARLGENSAGSRPRDDGRPRLAVLVRIVGDLKGEITLLSPRTVSYKFLVLMGGRSPPGRLRAGRR